MRFLILFIFLTTNVFANDVSEIKNIVIHKDLKVYDNVNFLDKNDKEINIKEFNGNLILLNFWATWCEPCKEEMPSLDRLQINENLSNLKIFAINISKENVFARVVGASKYGSKFLIFKSLKKLTTFSLFS